MQGAPIASVPKRKGGAHGSQKKFATCVVSIGWKRRTMPFFEMPCGVGGHTHCTGAGLVDGGVENQDEVGAGELRGGMGVQRSSR